MSITAKELAALLNLSPAAVSMALNNKSGVSTATRIKVVEAAKEYGYDFSRIEDARLSSRTRGSILFIIYKKSGAIVSDTPFFLQLTEGINLSCNSHSYLMNVNYIYDNDDLENQINEINGLNCEGIILLGTEMADHDFRPFTKLEIPIVILDTYFNKVNRNYVLINNHQGAFIATNYLIKRCECQPGYIRSSYSISNFEERANSFYNTIRANGMSPSKSIVHQVSPSIEGAYADMCTVLENKDEIAAAYFADNDLIACGAIKAFVKYGYRIPGDISIIGFDDMPMCAYVEPSLTTIQVNKQNMGQFAVERLMQLIDKPSSATAKIELSTELVVRNSVL